VTSEDSALPASLSPTVFASAAYPESVSVVSVFNDAALLAAASAAA
jgi:hypothetical protein